MLENKSKKSIYLKVVALVFAIICFGLILWKFDFEILFFIRDNIRNPIMNSIVAFYTTLGDDGIIWIVLGVILLIPKKTRKCGIMVLAALLVMLVIKAAILVKKR